MTEFSDMFEAGALPVLQSLHGATCTYTPTGASAVPNIPIIVTSDISEEREADHGTAMIREISATINTTDTGADVTVNKDTLVYDSDTFTVREVTERNGNVYQVLLISGDVVTRGPSRRGRY